MALQDVCGLHNSHLFPQWSAPLSRSFMPEDSTHLSGGGIHGEAFSARLSGRSGLSPLEFYMPIAEYLSGSPINFGQTTLSSAQTKLLEIDHLHPSLPSICLPPPTPYPISPSVPLPFTLSHGTTTLGFAFQGGVIAAADTRSSCSGLVACPMAPKVLPIHSHLVGTTSGTSADCALWKRILSRELRLYQLRHRHRLSTGGAAKLLSHMLHPFKGTELCVAATLCGWDGDEEKHEQPITEKQVTTTTYQITASESSNQAASVASASQYENTLTNQITVSDSSSQSAASVALASTSKMTASHSSIQSTASVALASSSQMTASDSSIQSATSVALTLQQANTPTNQMTARDSSSQSAASVASALINEMTASDSSIQSTASVALASSSQMTASDSSSQSATNVALTLQQANTPTNQMTASDSSSQSTASVVSALTNQMTASDLSIQSTASIALASTNQITVSDSYSQSTASVASEHQHINTPTNQMTSSDLSSQSEASVVLTPTNQITVSDSSSQSETSVNLTSTSQITASDSSSHSAAGVSTSIQPLTAASAQQVIRSRSRTGPRVIYVCSDGLRLQGELFSVGSGSPYAYSILDSSVYWGMSVQEATAVAREAVYRATYRDAYSGNNVDLYHVTAKGWRRRERENLKEEYYTERERERERVAERNAEKNAILKSSDGEIV